MYSREELERSRERERGHIDLHSPEARKRIEEAWGSMAAFDEEAKRRPPPF